MTLKIDPDLYKEFLKPSYDIVPTCVAEPIDQELVETIYLKIHNVEGRKPRVLAKGGIPSTKCKAQ